MAEPIRIPVILENVAKGASMIGGAAVGAAGAAGSAGSRVQGAMFGAGGPGEIGKGLGQIAKQLPGAGMFEQMTSAFKQGGPIGVMTAGVSGMLGFVKSIMESSKVFQGIAGSFFKIFGAMADVFLLPFLPLAMKGMQELLKHMPLISSWGEKAADWVMKMFNFVQGEGLWGAIKHGVGLGVDAIQKVLNDMWGAIQKWLGIAPEETARREGRKAGSTGQAGATLSTAEQSVLGVAGGIDALTGGALNVQGGVEAGMNQVWAAQGRHSGLDARPSQQYAGQRASAAGMTTEELDDFKMKYGYDPTQATARRQLGGRVPGGPGQGVPTVLHGGEEVIPRDVVSAMESAQGGVLGGFFGTMGEQIFDQAQKINSYVQDFKTQEGGAGGTIATFDSTVLEGDMPAIWTGIDDYLSGIGSQARDAANAATKLDFSGLTDDFDIDMELPSFQPPQEVFNELKMCFMSIQTCINANLEAMPVAVQNEADRIQAMLDEAGGLIAAGQGGEVDFAAIGAAIQDFNASVQDNIGKITESFNVKTSEIHSIMGMSYEEFVGMDEGFFGSANYFGSAVGQLGTYLTTMRETAIGNLKHRPCTPDEKADYYNDRCFAGCTAAMSSEKGHPCYVAPPKPPPPTEEEEYVPLTPPPVVEPPVDYGPGDFADIPGGGAGIHLPTAPGGSMAAAGAASALGPGGPMGLPDPVDYGPGDDVPSGIHLSFSAPVSSGGFNFGGGPAGRGFYAGGIVPGRMGAPRMIRAHGGERIMPNSSPGSSSRAATSNRVMHVTVNARGGLADVLGELQRFEDMDEASFFNSVL